MNAKYEIGLSVAMDVESNDKSIDFAKKDKAKQTHTSIHT